MVQRPCKLQFAALCYRHSESGKEILLITSRGTGRWIIPKGWPINGKSGSETALQEAWEEAGVSQGEIKGKTIGSYRYDKNLDSGLPVPVETMVFSVAVQKMFDEFPESDQRRRIWVSPSEAANMVQEPELQNLIAQF